jgi:hypothetical protein
MAVKSTMYLDKPCTNTQAQPKRVCEPMCGMIGNAVVLSSSYAGRRFTCKCFSRHDPFFFDDRNQVVRGLVL